MQLNDMILISVDDHVIEPPDAFAKHMPARFKSRAPRVETHNGKDCWIIDGRRHVLGGLNAVAGRPRSEYGVEPVSFSELRPGSYDVKARIDDMNANGVLGSMCFPSIVGFGGGLALARDDRDYGVALTQAYNDWHVHDWAGGAPGRLIPLGVLPLWDIAASVEEAKRLARMNVHAVTIPENPGYQNRLPSIHSDHWDPLWRVCADNNIVVCCHIGTGAPPPHTTLDEPVAAWMTSLPFATTFPAADWLFAPMWKKFPKLKMALSEAGAGWIPFLLERADFVYEHHGPWTHADLGDDLPSDIFRRHFIVCFIDDKYGLKNRHEIGVDNMTWECDYPHSDCTWPTSPELLWEGLKDVPDGELNKITHLNAMREFSFDPFAHRARETCTVGALRNAARHVDTGPTLGLGGAKPGDGSQVTMAHMWAETNKQTAGMDA